MREYVSDGNGYKNSSKLGGDIKRQFAEVPRLAKNILQEKTNRPTPN